MSSQHTQIERAREQIRLQQPRAAVPILREVLARQPALVRAHVLLGIALRDIGRLTEAEDCCRTALQLDPRSALAYHNMGELLRRRGRLPEAQACFEAVLNLDPGATPARIALAHVLLGQGQCPAAVQLYREAIAAGVSPAGLYRGLGVALKQTGDVVAALEAFRQAAAESGTAEAHQDLARALLEQGQFAEARDSAQDAIRLRPDLRSGHLLFGAALAALGDLEGALTRLTAQPASSRTRAECLSQLGSELLEVGQYERALDCFRRALESDPGNGVASHCAAALGGLNPEHAPEEYVRQLFDACAPHFDRALAELSYDVPRELTEAVLAVAAGPPPFDVLDLGCGTGLVGAELAARARQLVGVDLSSKMLERASERRLYTRLVCADLAAALRDESPCTYDVITAADVFIYVGGLDSVVPAARRVLRSGGLLAFSAEAIASPLFTATDSATGYLLGRAGRYAHRPEYLHALAARHEFEIALFRETRIRFEHHRPVPGYLAVWTAR